MFETPILFILFNRPDTTAIVFEAIKTIKPKFLFLAVDGPREGNEDDKIKCEKVRNYVLDNIDWECEVKKLFREKNLGCGKAVSSAISWFFDNVEEGIILEDDCVPSVSFFHFCSVLLEKYRKDEQIFVISGNNFQDKRWSDSSYYFSAFSHIWGWASWRRAWRYFDYSLKSINDNLFERQLRKYFPKKQQRDYWIRIYEMMKYRPIDTWDYQWAFSQWSKNGINIVPNVNLVKNIGIGNDATHTFVNVEGVMNVEASNLDFIIHPIRKRINKKADMITFYKACEQEKNIFKNHKIRFYLNHKIKQVLFNIKLLQFFFPNKSKEFELLLKNKGDHK